VLVPFDSVRSNLRLARRILHRNPDILPGIVRIPLGEEVSDATVALEEHAITLTPGQVLVDYSFLSLTAPTATHVLARTAYRHGSPLTEQTVCDHLAEDEERTGEG
jgi:multisubunit Na+/H+ antiporter MnhE subunit